MEADRVTTKVQKTGLVFAISLSVLLGLGWSYEFYSLRSNGAEFIRGFLVFVSVCSTVWSGIMYAYLWIHER